MLFQFCRHLHCLECVNTLHYIQMEDAVRNSAAQDEEKLTCSWCGATEEVAGTFCQSCGRVLVHIPAWAETTPSNQRRLFTRRRALVTVLVMAFLGFLVWLNFPFVPDPVIILFKRPTTSLTSDLLPSQWAMAGGDVGQSRYVTEVPRQPTGRVVWSSNLGEPTRSAPIVVNDVIYVGGQFKIIALDATNGQVLWERKTTGPVHSSLAVAGDTLYFGLLDHRFIAQDRNSGEPLWEFRAQDTINASPVVANGLAYVASYNGFLNALDAATGRPIWQYETLGQVSRQVSLQDGILFVNDDNGHLYILNARTGQERLRFRTPGPVNAWPVPAHGQVYFTSGGDVFAVDAGAKEIPGQFQFKKVWAQFWWWQLPGVPRPPGQQGGVWRFSPIKSGPAINSAPATTEETLYVGDLQGNFYAVEPAAGRTRWTFQAEGEINSSPLVLGDRVYFGTWDGILYALDRNGGSIVWQRDLGAAIDVPPVFYGGRLYVKTNDGRLYALE